MLFGFCWLKVGDCIGCLLCIEPYNDDTVIVPDFDKNDAKNKKRKPRNKMPGSKIIYYKNGKSMGVAFKDIYEGKYYPSVSLYFNATVCCIYYSNDRPQLTLVPTLNIQK